VTDSVSPEDEPKTKKRTAAFESDEECLLKMNQKLRKEKN
jgi:hypothetical protein